MGNLIDLLGRISHWILFVVLEVISLVLLFSYNGYHGSVWFSSANSISGSLNEATSFVESFFTQASINTELTQRNVELQQENEYLRSCLKAKGLNSKQCVPADKRDASIPAKVITNSLYERNNIITLDKGYKDGVRENMGVVDGNGVVGVVYLVSDHYCTVLSLLNSRTRLSCMIKHRGVFGMFHWRGKECDMAYVEDIPMHIRFNAGDTMITSGYSTIFPKGIPVGTVVEAYKAPDGFSCQVKIKLMTDFTRLRDVRVLKNSQWAERRSLETLSADSLGR